MSQAVHYIDFDAMSDLAGVHEIQALDGALSRLGDPSVDLGKTPAAGGRQDAEGSQ